MNDDGDRHPKESHRVNGIDLSQLVNTPLLLSAGAVHDSTINKPSTPVGVGVGHNAIGPNEDGEVTGKLFMIRFGYRYLLSIKIQD